MTEHEMRQILGALLGQATRKVVLPASLGLGLALSGCADRTGVSLDGGGDDAGVEQPAPDAVSRDRGMMGDSGAPSRGWI